MKLSLFDYALLKSSIAQTPTKPRDHSRLMIFDKKSNKIIHDKFFHLTKYLTPNDVLVFNNSKVFPARLLGQKESGGKAEILLLRKFEDNNWESLLKCRNPKSGLKLRFKRELEAMLIRKLSAKTWLLRFNGKQLSFYSILDKIGLVPLPPYILSREKQIKLKRQYQSVFAKFTGSSAAPTASLHFTKRLIKQIQKSGCQKEFITLHVGLGTFEPVNTEVVENFKIHEEWLSADNETIRRLLKAKKSGKRIIAVGTTSVRALETIFSGYPRKPEKLFSKFTNIFIYPGYKFKFVDALITNFHLPKSSLLMLVSAFAGRMKILELYRQAISRKYRFYSFGDAMFVK
ncbi:tRNA preQ1(34) S-adenosylmethionine ribosyltransferase-isomerase QueA [Candidatus Falkowbacteria bacterium]|nr:tRNA preQ1(34) S-adenosylmethionine ribosyltransferase-isomerase QueA [Candidatus Falkowbacteria bacterium]